MNRSLRLFGALFLSGVFAVTTPMASNAEARPGDTSRRSSNSASYRVWLEKQVRHELVMLPYYSVFDYLAFRIDGDRVTLLGQVVRPSTRSDAEARVKKIEGVTGVLNQIEVLPLSTFDDQLRVAAYRAIYRDTMLSRYSLAPVPAIHIIVKNGHITLEGAVSSATERNVANIRASGVSGAFSVTNHLRVEKS